MEEIPREESIGDLEANETHIERPQDGRRWSRIAGADAFDVRRSQKGVRGVSLLSAEPSW